MQYIPGYKYRKNGYGHEVVARYGDVCVSLMETGHYEVFEVKKVPESEMFGKVVAGHEAIPSNEEWGKIGFTCWGLVNVANRVAYLQNKINERNSHHKRRSIISRQ